MMMTTADSTIPRYNCGAERERERERKRESLGMKVYAKYINDCKCSNEMHYRLKVWSMFVFLKENEYFNQK